MAALPDNFLLIRERERNTTTRGHFDAYAQHRAQQMALLETLSGKRIAILGAGNCNDLDLSTLARAFNEIHLFDIDAEALSVAVAVQPLAVQRVCHLHVQDLTGIAGFIDEWRSNPPEPMAAQIAAWTQLSQLVDTVGAFDVVVSTCMLSQAAINLRDFFGIVPALNSALCAAVAGHVMLAATLTQPGGTLLVVSDCITNRFPIYEETERRGALEAIFYLAAQGAAFPGTDPSLIADLLTGSNIVQTEFKNAWIWALSPEQTYLVYALQGTRGG
jgi:hypothetical protein